MCLGLLHTHPPTSPSITQSPASSHPVPTTPPSACPVFTGVSPLCTLGTWRGPSPDVGVGSHADPAQPSSSSPPDNSQPLLR